MGIPSYFSQIVKSCPSIVKNLKKERMEFDHLYMDCNSIIYDAVHGLDASDPELENKLIEQVIFSINGYIDQIRPLSTIFIAFDGVAPFAKMNQQKTRRYKTNFMAMLDFIEPIKSNVWSTSNITPGTQFMNKLSSRLSIEFTNKEAVYNVRKLIFSGPDQVGEGEHKIFKHIRSIANEDENVIVYGLDSDLIMLSIFHRHLFKGIYVFREAPEFIKSSIELTDSTDPYLLDISMLCGSILNEIDPKFNDKQRIMDYVFMCFMLGNDFLPHFPALNIRTNGIAILIGTYSKVIGNAVGRYFISTSNKIQWNIFRLFMNEFTNSETIFIKDEYLLRNRYDKRRWKTESKIDRDNALLNIPVICRADEQYICPDTVNWEQRYYKSLFDMERTSENLDEICTNYIEGLEWVFKYYIGDCPDWRWTYKFHYPPLLVDLYNYVPKTERDFIKQCRPSFSANVQLAYVLPPAQFDLLPIKSWEFLVSNFSEYYSNKIEFKWAFCRYFWESHVCFNHIGVETLDIWEKELQ